MSLGLTETQPASRIDYFANLRNCASPGRSAACGLLLAMFLGVAGCAPAITHGPRVRAGAAGGASVSLGVVSAAGEYPDILPPSVVFLRHGWAADSVRGQPGALIGAQISPFVLWAALNDREVTRDLLEAAEVDFYVQAAEGNPRGAGVVVSPHVLMPYVQYGEDKPSGDSWYTTHGIALSFWENYGAVYWAPSISFREVGLNNRHAAHFQLGGALGFAEYGYARERAPVWMLSAGLVIEFNEPEPDE